MKNKGLPLENSEVVRSSFFENQVGSILKVVAPISKNASIKNIKEIFENNLDLKSLPVEDEIGSVFGIVTRERFLNYLSSFWNMFGEKNIKNLIESNVTSLDAREYIEDSLSKIIKKEMEANLFQDFLIFHSNTYLGIGNVFDLISQVTKIKNTALENAKKIQNFFINKNESVKVPFKIHKYINASSQLGGDFYKIFKISDSYFLISVFDVSGKNVPASLITVVLSSFFSTYENMTIKKNKDFDKNEFIETLNQVCFDQTNAWMFVSGILMFADIKKKELEYYNFGHPPAIFTINDFYLKKLKLFSKKTSMSPLGISPSLQKIKSMKIKIRRKLRVLLFTDGFPDAQNAEGEMFGIERIKKLIIENEQEVVDIFFTNLKNRLRDFTRQKVFSDDATLLLLDFQELF